jgi:probable F420-dependent oxidoreductase
MAPARPFRFAVQAVRARSAGEWRSFARSAEALGYSTLFLADHYLGRGPAMDRARQPLQHVAPIAAMAVAAAVTDTLRVGCRVFCVDYHVPAVLAKEAATLDLLSDGRLEFGIGAGWSEHEYAAMGLPFAPPASRVAKLKEVVGLFKAHCGGELLAVEGHHATASGYAGLPRPPQTPHPPIMIGGSRRVVLSFAAREADIVSLNNVDFVPVNGDGLTPQQEAERRYGYVRDAAGDRLDGPDGSDGSDTLDIESSPFFTRLTDDPDAACAEIARLLGIAPDGLADHPNVLVGTVDEVVDTLQERRERYGVNYVTVQQAELERFAPVVERLAGC